MNKAWISNTFKSGLAAICSRAFSLSVISCILMRSVITMKFSYRVVTIIFVTVSAIALYVFWDKEWDQVIPWKKTQKPKEIHQSIYVTPLKHHGNGKNEYVEGKEECHFGKSFSVKSDFSTFDIFQTIDKERSPDNKKNKQNKMFHSQDRNVHEPVASKLPLKVILVPHSHNDPGWHKTVTSYFEDQTKLTLDNMVEKMVKFPNMTFVWAESVFLNMWFSDLDYYRQQQVKNLIKRRQLEIVVGSWVVPDEANPHFFALVDQMIEGHQWLEKKLNVKPQNTWTLDPFGYSSTHPYLYKKAGFKNMIILRVHEKLKEKLQEKKALEFFWNQPWDKKHSSSIFTQMMPYMLYNIKHTCGPDHHICLLFDFRKIPGEYSESRAEPITNTNVERLSKMLIGQYQQKANLFKHNVVLVPLGDDFRYDRPIEWDQQYKNYMMLFNYINKRKEWNVQARFGTLQDYFDEVKRTVEENPALQETSFPSLVGDFFPYTDTNNQYWSGYFTTRPFDKNLGREVEVNLRAAEIFNTLARLTAEKNDQSFDDFANNMALLPQARQDLGLFQHHDAITGTARSWVVMDYEQRLHNALDTARKVMKSSIAYLLSVPQKSIHSTEAKSLRMLHPEKLEVTFAHKNKAHVVLLNANSHERIELIKLTVPTYHVSVYDENGNLLPSQINPTWMSVSEMNKDIFELLFYAKLPALSLTTFELVKSAEAKSFPAYVRLYNVPEFKLLSGLPFNIMPPGGEHIIMENGAYRARFSPRTGMLHSVTTRPIIKTIESNLEFLMYRSRGSGAYIFNPAGPAVDTEMNSRPVLRVIKGPLVSEIQIIQELVQSTVRLCNTTSLQGQAIEIDNVVDIRSKDEKELIMRLTSNIKHNGTFYTDMNAFQMSKRKRFTNLPPEANYYPSSAFTYIEDNYTRLSLIMAQPLGVSSQSEGSLEVMLDRRLMNDDNRGLGEGVYDNKRAPSRFYLLIENKYSAFESAFPSLLSHRLANNLRDYIFPLLSDDKSSRVQYRGLTEPFPCDIELTHLRSLDPRSAALVLHRVGYSCGLPSTSLTCPLTSGKLPPLETLFSGVNFKSVQATSLSLMHNTTMVSQLEPMELYTYKTFL